MTRLTLLARNNMDITADAPFNRLVTLIRGAEATNPNVPITPERTLDSFGFDDLDWIELAMSVEDEFELAEMLDEQSLENCKTVGHLVTLVEKEIEKC